MGEITLIRHGQANSTAQDEASYDQLSPLGHDQATWLGTHLRDHDAPFDAVLTGTLHRHRQTHEAMGDMGVNPVEDARLNELDYFNLASALRDTRGVPMPGPGEFAAHVPQVLAAWHAGDIQGEEPFAAFETRVTSILQEAAMPGRRVICITSGGVIGMVLRHLLDLTPQAMAHVMLPVMNSSIHRLHVSEAGTYLAGFNAIPHLAAPDRAHARTTI